MWIAVTIMGRSWPRRDSWLYGAFLPHAAHAATKHVNEVSLDVEKMLPSSVDKRWVKEKERAEQSEPLVINDNDLRECGEKTSDLPLTLRRFRSLASHEPLDS